MILYFQVSIISQIMCLVCINIQAIPQFGLKDVTGTDPHPNDSITIS